MRIISGKYGGRNIVAPGSLPVRPTTDFAKTGLFNILNNNFDFEEILVLDLFCGIGSISFEFASRGTPSVTSVDQNTGCINFIKEYAQKLKDTAIHPVKSDAFDFINTYSQQFDIVFADPPFDAESTDLLPQLILEKGLVKKEGWLIVEHQSKRKLNSIYEPKQVRTYGNCAFSIFVMN